MPVPKFGMHLSYLKSGEQNKSAGGVFTVISVGTNYYINKVLDNYKIKK